jgi:hypothetical protein
MDDRPKPGRPRTLDAVTESPLETGITVVSPKERPKPRPPDAAGYR